MGFADDWTTPRDWTAGEVVTGTILDLHLRDNLNALADNGIYLIERQILTSDAELEFSSIPQTYEHLWLVGSVRSSSGAVAIDHLVNNLTGLAYYTIGYAHNSAGFTTVENVGGGSARVGGMGALSTAFSGLEVFYPNYADSSKYMTWFSRSNRLDALSTTNVHNETHYGFYASNAAISTIDLMANGAATFEGVTGGGSEFTLYGVGGGN